jgi:hypothetical protein
MVAFISLSLLDRLVSILQQMAIPGDNRSRSQTVHNLRTPGWFICIGSLVVN